MEKQRLPAFPKMPPRYIHLKFTLPLCLLLAGMLSDASSALAADEICASCGGQVSVSGSFTHRKEAPSLVVEGTNSRADAFRKVPQPKLSLCGFRRVSVKSGKAAKVTVEIPAERLRYWNVGKKHYVVEPGGYEFLVGAASDDIRLKLPMTIASQ